jgi:hypothetical protein
MPSAVHITNVIRVKELICGYYGRLEANDWRSKSSASRRATVAVAHTLLVLCFQVLKSGQPYDERGLPALDEKHKNRLICHHVRRLGKLGIRVRSLTLDKPPAKPNKNPITKAKPPKPKEKAAKKTTKSSA